MNLKLVIEIIGWIGVALILSAYFLVSFQYIVAGSIIFLLLNSIGGTSMIFYSFYKKSWQPLLLNFVWVTIALGSFLSILL